MSFFRPISLIIIANCGTVAEIMPSACLVSVKILLGVKTNSNALPHGLHLRPLHGFIRFVTKRC